MEIPEVLYSVGYFLAQDSLASSVRVCKFWHEVLEPHLYRHIGRLLPLPPADKLRQYLCEIYSLSLERRDLNMIKYESHRQLLLCRNLKALDLTLFEWEHSNDCPEMDLITTNRMLSRLRIFEGESSSPSRPWGRVFADSCPVLQELSLTNVHLKADATGHLLKIAQSLVILRLDRCLLAFPDTMAQLEFKNMKALLVNDLFDSPAQELELIRRCPRLEKLQWAGNWPKDARFIFQEIRLLRWSHLTELEFPSGFRQLPDIHVATMLDACGRLRILDVNGSGFSYRSLKSLERHLDTLEELNLIDCFEARGWMCHWILTRSSRLERFYGEYIMAYELIVDCPKARAILNLKATEERDIDDGTLRKKESKALAGQEYQDTLDELNAVIAGYEEIRLSVHTQPWACLGLKEFACSIIHHLDWTDPDSQRLSEEWNSQILGRFSKLKKLENWNLGVHPDSSTIRYHYQSNWHGLRLSLKSGLAQLDTLHCLQSLDFLGTRQNLEVEDCLWMLDHFPTLQEISNDLSDDDDTCAELMSLMKHLVFL